MKSAMNYQKLNVIFLHQLNAHIEEHKNQTAAELYNYSQLQASLSATFSFLET